MRLLTWSELVHVSGCPECTARRAREFERERMRELLYPVPTQDEIDEWMMAGALDDGGEE
jgi:hypothetical protein